MPKTLRRNPQRLQRRQGRRTLVPTAAVPPGNINEYHPLLRVERASRNEDVGETVITAGVVTGVATKEVAGSREQQQEQNGGTWHSVLNRVTKYPSNTYHAVDLRQRLVLSHRG